MKIIISENNRIIICCIIVTLLILLGISQSIFMTLALAISLFIVVTYPSVSQKLAFSFFLLPYSAVFVKGNVGGYTYYVMIMFALCLVFLYKRYRIEKNLLLSSVLCILFMGFRSIDVAGMSLPLRGQYVIVGLILLLFYCNSKYDVEFEHICLMYCLGVLSAAIIGTFSPYIPNLQNYMYDGFITDGGVVRYCGLFTNPNYYTYDITVCFSGLLFMCSYKKKIAMPYLILLIGLAFAGIVSISMSFVLSMLLALFIYLFIVGKSKKGIYALSVFAGVFIIVYFATKNNQSIQALIDRIVYLNTSTNDLSSLTTKRTDIWQYFLQLIFNNPSILFSGAGLFSINRSAHSFYIEMVYYYGLLGVSFFTIFLYSIFKKTRECFCGVKIHNINYLIILVPVLFRAAGISLVAFMNFWMSLLLCLIAYGHCYKMNIKEKEIYD